MVFKRMYKKIGYTLQINLLKLYFHPDCQIMVINDIYKPLCKLRTLSRISAGPNKIASYMLKSNETEVFISMCLMGKWVFPQDKTPENVVNKSIDVISLYLERELRKWVRECFYINITETAVEQLVSEALVESNRYKQVLAKMQS